MVLCSPPDCWDYRSKPLVLWRFNKKAQREGPWQIVWLDSQAEDEGGLQKRNCGVWPWTSHPGLELPSSNLSISWRRQDSPQTCSVLSPTGPLPTESWPPPCRVSTNRKQRLRDAGSAHHTQSYIRTHTFDTVDTVAGARLQPASQPKPCKLKDGLQNGPGQLMDPCEARPSGHLR